ncbi:unnamed protein product [Mytilus coruscus]|uniref:C1q domain-containing protein n=1 Tax=Mytilus coruscus TaxID=42192 RepID=A0A6J8E2X4_MYTCO|nr:unnamed protein product [Mytilus coruscus]
MNRLTNRVDNLENENQRLNEEHKELKETTFKLKTLNTVFVEEQKKIQESIETKFVVGEDEVKRLSSSMKDVTNRLEHLENKNKLLEDENAGLKTRTFILEVNLGEESVKLDEKYVKLKEKSDRLEEKSVRLERSNMELVQETYRIKQSIASQSVVEGAANVITQVGFTAVLTYSANLGPHQTIIYDKAITHKGDGYDIRHGHFSAPVCGLYLISATVLSSPDAVIRTEIVKENEQLVAMVGRTMDMGSHTVVVFLNEREQVWVRHFNEATSIVRSGKDRYFSSFLGVLLAAS